ncbi:unnamed protein product [Kuraishia capsulata CBS 1993]|uniref:Processing of GAS1 and ALP protein 2 n=1 Tax=Kuraishia capsulata CBS 1993 TaxID=1382522 RepID=W6MKP7_9ASCO|nr:uncharacterized protein KUCA_T00001291001 [Kuraishia capsulata CBS 1993]CDK25322.1 unnamed protein product [Kuraishia capsulata CBS 1993]
MALSPSHSGLPSFVMIELSLDGLYNRFFADYSIYSLLRLISIIGGYIFLRQILLRDIKRRQLKAQLDSDNKQKQADLIDNPNDLAKATGVQASDQIWGWGKSTRQRAKRQEKIVQEMLERDATRNNGDYDSDEDIADLLESDSD